MSETLGSTIRELRKSRQLTQLDVAYIASVPRCKISQYERDKQVPSKDNLSAIITSIGVNYKQYKEIMRLWERASGPAQRKYKKVLPRIPKHKAITQLRKAKGSHKGLKKQ